MLLKPPGNKTIIIYAEQSQEKVAIQPLRSNPDQAPHWYAQKENLTNWFVSKQGKILGLKTPEFCWALKIILVPLVTRHVWSTKRQHAFVQQVPKMSPCDREWKKKGRRCGEGKDKQIPIATLSKGLTLPKLSMRFSSSSCCLVCCQSWVLSLAGQSVARRAEITRQLSTPRREGLSLAKKKKKGQRSPDHKTDCPPSSAERSRVFVSKAQQH